MVCLTKRKFLVVSLIAAVLVAIMLSIMSAASLGTGPNSQSWASPPQRRILSMPPNQRRSLGNHVSHVIKLHLGRQHVVQHGRGDTGHRNYRSMRQLWRSC